IGKQSAAAYHGAERELGARQQAHVDSIKRANEEALAQSQAHSTNAQGLSNDPTAVATRRCLELGGSSAGCMGKGFMSGFMNLIGGDRKSTRLNSSHDQISYAVFCLKKKKKKNNRRNTTTTT